MYYFISNRKKRRKPPNWKWSIDFWAYIQAEYNYDWGSSSFRIKKIHKICPLVLVLQKIKIKKNAECVGWVKIKNKKKCYPSWCSAHSEYAEYVYMRVENEYVFEYMYKYESFSFFFSFRLYLRNDKENFMLREDKHTHTNAYHHPLRCILSKKYGF